LLVMLRRPAKMGRSDYSAHRRALSIRPRERDCPATRGIPHGAGRAFVIQHAPCKRALFPLRLETVRVASRNEDPCSNPVTRRVERLPHAPTLARHACGGNHECVIPLK
jgi:hypothetical protein